MGLWQILQMLLREALMWALSRSGKSMLRKYWKARPYLIFVQRTNTAPSIGPLLGALLTAFEGWRWIFWLLTILSASCWLAMLVSLPETARQIVDNGSKVGSWAHKAPLKSMRPRGTTSNSRGSKPTVRVSSCPNPLPSLKVLLRPDSCMIIAAISVLYCVSSCTQATLSTLFIKIHNLNQIKAGLIYLPYGIGCAMAALLTGKQLDRDYRRTAVRYGLPVEKKYRSTLTDFPIEEARLRNIWWPLLTAAGSTVGYGWSLKHEIVSSLVSLSDSKPTNALAHRHSIDNSICIRDHRPNMFYSNDPPARAQILLLMLFLCSADLEHAPHRSP